MRDYKLKIISDAEYKNLPKEAQTHIGLVGPFALSAVKDDRVIGCIIFSRYKTEAQLRYVYVEPDERRKEIGSDLIYIARDALANMGVRYIYARLEGEKSAVYNLGEFLEANEFIPAVTDSVKVTYRISDYVDSPAFVKILNKEMSGKIIAKFSDNKDPAFKRICAKMNVAGYQINGTELDLSICRFIDGEKIRAFLIGEESEEEITVTEMRCMDKSPDFYGDLILEVSLLAELVKRENHDKRYTVILKNYDAYEKRKAYLGEPVSLIFVQEWYMNLVDKEKR